MQTADVISDLLNKLIKALGSKKLYIMNKQDGLK